MSDPLIQPYNPPNNYTSPYGKISERSIQVEIISNLCSCNNMIGCSIYDIMARESYDSFHDACMKQDFSEYFEDVVIDIDENNGILSYSLDRPNMSNMRMCCLSCIRNPFVMIPIDGSLYRYVHSKDKYLLNAMPGGTPVKESLPISRKVGEELKWENIKTSEELLNGL